MNEIINEKSLSIIKDPFNKTFVKLINIDSRENMFDETKWRHTGVVKFENGNTHGQQNFTGDSFNNVLEQINQFLKTI